MTAPSVSVAVIGGSGVDDLPGATVLDRLRMKTRYGKPSAEVAILDAGAGPFAFIPRHGQFHQLAPDAIPYKANIDALNRLGVRRIIATCVVGSLNADMAPGEFVVPDQFVEFTTGRVPKVSGPPKHLPMGQPYCPAMRSLLFDTTTGHTNAKVHAEATVVVTQGPRFATRAENRWYANQGWDIINMTQFPEVYLAREYGICYAAVASITDYAVGVGVTAKQIGSTTSMAPVLKVFHSNKVLSQNIAINAVADLKSKPHAPCTCAKPMPPEYYRQEEPMTEDEETDTTRGGGPHTRSVASCLLTSVGIKDEIFELEQPGANALAVNSPELVREVLASKADFFSKGPVQQGMFRDLLGQSISMVEGDAHTRLRRLLGPMFTREQAQQTLTTVIDVFNRSTGTWIQQPSIDLFEELNALTIRSVGATLIAEQNIWDDGPFMTARKRIWQRMNELATREVSKNEAPDEESTFQADSDVEFLRGFVSGLLLKRLCEPTTDILSGLAILVRQGKISGAQAVDQLIALLMAAHETNAGALYWSIALLNTDPHWMRRIISELAVVLGHRDPKPEAIDRLVLTQAAIFESLRLYPPAGRQFRVTTRDVTIGHEELSPDTPVFISHLALHSHPSLFDEPATFRPDRWIGMGRAHDGFIPFGLGRHRCLGRHYALHELTVLLAMILQRFDVSFPDGVDTSASLGIALRPAVPARVVISRRHP